MFYIGTVKWNIFCGQKVIYLKVGLLSLVMIFYDVVKNE